MARIVAGTSACCSTVADTEEREQLMAYVSGAAIDQAGSRNKVTHTNLAAIR